MTSKRKLRVLSASQYERWQCPRRGWLEYVQGHKQPTSDSLILGSRVHSIAEGYLKGELTDFSITPGAIGGQQLAEAASIFAPAIPLIPRPGTPGLVVEQAISFETEHSAWRGAIDFLYETDSSKVIGDFKTTKSIKYRKTERELKQNVQANLYAHWASYPGAKKIKGEWVYLSTGPERGASVTHVDFDIWEVENFVGKVDERAALIQNWYEIPATESADNLAVDTTKCFEYGKPCHHRVAGCCKINQPVGFAERNIMGNSILDRIAKERFKKLQEAGLVTSGNAGTTTEETEFNHPAEPPPGSMAFEPGVAEAGFINPRAEEKKYVDPSEPGKTHDKPFFGATVADNAALVAGLESLKAEDLERAGETAERQSLKAECVRLGLCEPNSRLRIDALKKLLGENHTPAGKFARAEELVSAGAFTPEEAREVLSEPIPSLQRKPKPIIILYVDCLPNTAVVDAHTMVGNLLPDVLKQVGEQHVKFVQYGKGSAALAVALEKHLADKVLDQVFVDSRTVENDVLAVLVRSADVVVRGLR